MGSKYRAIPTVVDGYKFASRWESERYLQLKLMARRGLISDLVWDKKKLRFPLYVNGLLVCVYECDFSYWDHEKHEMVYEDAKSKATVTPVYRLKKKLMKAIHGITIHESYRS